MTFLLDTSALNRRGLRKFLELCRDNEHTALVPAIVYAERVFQLRRKKGDAFKQSDIDQWFDNFAGTLSVLNLDMEDARELARVLHDRFPDDDRWAKEKIQAHTRRLNPGNSNSELKNTKLYAAPLDFYIVGLAGEHRPVITEDGGPEWQGWPEGYVVSFDEAFRLAGEP